MMNTHSLPRPLSTSSLCVHADAAPDPLTGAVMTPVYFTSTYAQSAPGKHKGYEYSRTQNPTRASLEQALARLEGGRWACAFASGLAAEDAVLHLLKPGEEAVCSLDLYGGSFRLMKRIHEPRGPRFRFVDTTRPAMVHAAIGPATRMLWIETPSNPLLRLTDIAAIRGLLKRRGLKNILLVVDNTFATPIAQQPLKLGADIVVHSTTKYLGGHSDVIGGAVITDNPKLAEHLRFHQNAAGAVPGPMDCYLILRGIKTLHLRMERHNANARAVALFLKHHKKVARLYYCGFGGMVSFEIKGPFSAVTAFFRRLKIFTVGESLGGVESLACHPWVMTHASVPEKERVAAGIRANLIRLSVGIEDSKDLIEDLRNALR